MFFHLVHCWFLSLILYLCRFFSDIFVLNFACLFNCKLLQLSLLLSKKWCGHLVLNLHGQLAIGYKTLCITLVACVNNSKYYICFYVLVSGALEVIVIGAYPVICIAWFCAFRSDEYVSYYLMLLSTVSHASRW